MKQTILALFLGLVSVDQINSVGAVSLSSHHKKRRHRHHNRDYLMTEYVSPFGMDAAHGYGGNDQKRLESLIDKGEHDEETAIEKTMQLENQESQTKGKIGLVQQEKRHRHGHKHRNKEEEVAEAEDSGDASDAERARQDAKAARR